MEQQAVTYVWMVGAILILGLNRVTRKGGLFFPDPQHLRVLQSNFTMDVMGAVCTGRGLFFWLFTPAFVLATLLSILWPPAVILNGLTLIILTLLAVLSGGAHLLEEERYFGSALYRRELGRSYQIVCRVFVAHALVIFAVLGVAVYALIERNAPRDIPITREFQWGWTGLVTIAMLLNILTVRAWRRIPRTERELVVLEEGLEAWRLARLIWFWIVTPLLIITIVLLWTEYHWIMVNGHTWLTLFVLGAIVLYLHIANYHGDEFFAWRLTRRGGNDAIVYVCFAGHAIIYVVMLGWLGLLLLQSATPKPG